MEFRILGPVDVVDDAGTHLGVGGTRERALLSRLVLSADHVVSTDVLIEDLWGTQPTEGIVHALRVHVSRLRRALRQASHDDVLLTRPRGYLLRVAPDSSDLARFEALLRTARRNAAADDHIAAAEALRKALALWRGPALADVLEVPFVRSHAARLEETRLAAVEQRIDHDLACGRHTELVGELAQLTATNPLRERLWGARMLALYRSGRQADALGAYRDLRSTLHDELALEPGAALVRLHHAILSRQPELDWSPPAAQAQSGGAPTPANGPARTRYAKTDGVNIAYQVIGHGPVDVVLVLGFVSNIDLYWENPGWRQIFDRLTTFCRLIIWDKRGTGLSDPVDHVPTLDERVDDLLAVMDAAGCERATLFGISEGGPMSLLFAATHPDRTRGLILYGVSPRFSQAPDWPWGWPAAKVAGVLAELDADWGEGALLDLFAPGSAGDELARRSWGRTQRAGASPGMGRAVMEAMVAIDCREILPAVRVQTLLLHRQGDQVAHIDAARYMTERLPDARLVEFSGDNHLITSGDLQPLLDEVEGFVAAGAEARDPERDRVLATLLVADLVRSTGTAPACRHRDGRDAPDERRAALRRELARFRGQEIPPTGDGPVAAFFMSPSRAIACARAIQAALAPFGLTVKAGVHIGECDVTGGAVSGPPVQIADRVAEVADAGEILVTSTVRDLLAETDTALSFHAVSTPHGLPGTRALYTVVPAGGA